MTNDISIKPPRETRDFFSGRLIVDGFHPETLAAAYALGRTGRPLEGELLAQAFAFHRSRGDRAGYLSEGADNDLVDWFCQGHREYDFERYGADPMRSTVALAIERNVHRDGHWYEQFLTPIAMLWNLEERKALADETDVRALLGVAEEKPAEPPALPGASNLLGLPGVSP